MDRHEGSGNHSLHSDDCISSNSTRGDRMKLTNEDYNRADELDEQESEPENTITDDDVADIHEAQLDDYYDQGGMD